MMMKHQKLFVLFAITIVVIVVATLFSRSRAPQTVIEKAILFPELTDKINDVSRIDITGSGERHVVLKKTPKGQWTVENADNYPAQFDKIKDTVVSLSELKILATKTNKINLYPELGVEGPQHENTQSLLLTLKDQTDATLASLIIGKPRKKSSGNNRPNLYVRKTDDMNALLVEGYLNITARQHDWYERNIIHIPGSRIQNINILKSTGDRLIINKESPGDTDFNVVEGKTGSPSVLLNKLGTFFENINVEGVHAIDKFEFPEETTLTTFKTFNGLLVTVKSALSNGKAYAHFSFTTATASSINQASEDEDNDQTINAEEESQIWDRHLGQWVYEIPEFKYETLDVNVASSAK